MSPWNSFEPPQNQQKKGTNLFQKQTGFLSMTLCFFIAWWSLESSVCLPPWAIWRKMRKRYWYEVKGAAGGCGGASDGCWMRNLIPALLTLVFYQTSQRLELFFKEEENTHSWKINVLLDYFSSFLSPSHTHTCTHTLQGVKRQTFPSGVSTDGRWLIFHESL